MNKVEQSRIRKIFSTFFLVIMLTSCMGGGGSKVRYYLVDPIDTEFTSESIERELAIEIIDVNIPQYLERFQIVTRDGKNELRLSDNNQWGENLRKNLIRTLARNLSRMLSVIDIGTPLNRSSTTPHYRIHIHIVQYERDTDGKVKLVGRWQLSDGEENELGMHGVKLESDWNVGEGNYDEIVAAMQELYGQFCSKIASSIVDLENS